MAGSRHRGPRGPQAAGQRDVADQGRRDRRGEARGCPGVKRSYSTRFARDENPMSEGDLWLNGKTDGIDWADVITKDGRAYGSVTRMAAAEKRVEQGSLGAGVTAGSLPQGDYDDPTPGPTREGGRNHHQKNPGFNKKPTKEKFQE